MVKETEFYDILQIDVSANQDEIKRAYRRMAVKTHPDKNRDDADADSKFQAVSEAYQVLSDPKLREKYDKFGKEQATPDDGFQDPVVFATNIFGGGAFESYIGEIAMIKELGEMNAAAAESESDTADSTTETQTHASSGKSNPASNRASTQYNPNPAMNSIEYHESTSPLHASDTHTSTGTFGNHNSRKSSDQGKASSATPPPPSSSSQTPNSGSGGGGGILGHRNHHESAEASKIRSDKEAKKKRHAELKRIEEEARVVREQRIEDLTQALVGKLGVYTELEKTEENRRDYIKSLEAEANNLKMESFGLRILHTIGSTYYSRGSLYLKSQKYYGLGGVFSRFKDAGNMAKEIIDTVSTAVEAEHYVTAASKTAEADVSPENQEDMERTILGKVLGALWAGSKLEIIGILRAVCDNVLHDPKVSSEKRKERAEALKIMGKVFKKTERTPEEMDEMQFFETLVASADAKRAKKIKKDFGLRQE